MAHSPFPQTIAGDRSVGDLIRAGARRHPERELLVFEDAAGTAHSFSWTEVLAHSRGAATAIARAGVGRGDRVHLHLRNRPEFLFAWFGAALLGASIVPTNSEASVEEMAYIVGHAATRISIAEDAGREAVLAARARAGAAGPVLRCEEVGRLAAEAAGIEEAEVEPGEELGVIYTSGTTSRPKGVIVTHANYVYAGEVVAKAFALRPEDRLIVALPLFHANAQYYSTMGALSAGATIVLLPRFSASCFVDQCRRHRATVASLFAAPIRMLLAQEPRPDWREHRLRLVLFAQNLSATELALWEERVGAPLLRLYGMTETIGPPLANPIWGDRRADALGRVTLGYACRVVGEGGGEAAAGEPGELHVGGIPGVSLTPGYLSDPEATAAALVDGWIRTGDVVRVDGDGFFSFVDRRKDMIKRAGENVAAGEVEAVLLDHPGVTDAAVIGVADPIRDEAIVAFAVLGEGRSPRPADLVEWCSERLSRFRVPEEVRLVAELPRTSVGKVQKHVLKREYEREKEG
ncbi:MAG TPA: AMP-binding protein [Solirubrobacterales bacterium]|nr:AMP-binding protein [Solirubrobacterales bacterium]